MNYVADDLLQILTCQILGNNKSQIKLNNVSIDSRQSYHNINTLFFAIQGKNNGHQYINELKQKRVCHFVISDSSYATDKTCTYFLVKDTKNALQELGKFHRKQSNIPIIGITGSNGKTTVKEWLAESLVTDFNVVKTPGSFNSQFGVPLSILQIEKEHTLGIFEAGISQSGEMEQLATIISPTIGIFTNVGSAHDYGFKSREAKIKEKLKLFKNCEVVICQSKYKDLFLASQNLFTWGEDGDVSITLSSDHININYKGKKQQIPFESRDSSSFENIGHIIAFHIFHKQSIESLASIINITQVKMRLEVIEGINNTTLIDDSYNNDPEGFKRAINFLKQQEKDKPRAIICSGFEQLNYDYHQLIKEIEHLDIHLIITIGKELEGLKTTHFTNVDSFLNSFDQNRLSNHVVLIKGARKYGFEQITEVLQKEFHETKLEVDLSALQHNYNFFKSLLKPSTKVMVMVKAYAYGSGNLPIARLMEFNNVDYLGVAYLDEGIELRKNGISTPIMVMNPSLSSIKPYLDYNLEPEIYSLNQLRGLVKAVNTSIGIHLKIDTGMHRLGFNPGDITPLIQIINNTPNIKIKSIFSHLASADDSDVNFTNQQIKQFDLAAKAITKSLPYKPLLHILNSSGIQNYANYQYDMVRLGIGLYGVGSKSNQEQLKHISKLTTTISQIREVEAGETVGYSQAGKVTQNSRIATIAIGYADGYDRRFGNGIGSVLINNQFAPVVGNVCMDMTMIDVSNLNVKEGDEVIIFSPELPVNKLADKISTIPYEILTNISERVKRIFIKN